ncbi:MAG TPA: hypothetical protein PKJ03_02030 [Methanoregulaceae archaeon]|jgi:hypothetical protein|nr:hypothetical protein [Methanoregulaceae archaeon]
MRKRNNYKKWHTTDKKWHNHNRNFFTGIFHNFELVSWKHPILCVGIFTFVALILFRISLFDASFQPYQSFNELRFWIAIIACIMVIVAFLAFLAWWRRHVPDFHLKGTGDITWKNR